MSTQPKQYNSLSELSAYKEELNKQIEADEQQIKRLWNSLFKQPKPGRQTTAQRINSMLSIGGGIIDGALLGWKLYRKFKR